MAKYDGTYSCGHVGTVDVVGKVSERQYWIDKEFSKVCDDCKIKEIEVENEKSLKAATKMKLLVLQGSEKQVAWAVTLRQKFVKEWAENREEFTERISKMEEEHQGMANKELSKFDDTYKQILDIADSKFWINQKNKEAKMLIVSVIRHGADNV